MIFSDPEPYQAFRRARFSEGDRLASRHRVDSSASGSECRFDGAHLFHAEGGQNLLLDGLARLVDRAGSITARHWIGDRAERPLAGRNVDMLTRLFDDLRPVCPGASEPGVGDLRPST